MAKSILLSHKDRLTLALLAESPPSRAQVMARAILMLADGFTRGQAAGALWVSSRTVGLWKRSWLSR